MEGVFKKKLIKIMGLPLAHAMGRLKICTASSRRIHGTSEDTWPYRDKIWLHNHSFDPNSNHGCMMTSGGTRFGCITQHRPKHGPCQPTRPTDGNFGKQDLARNHRNLQKCGQCQGREQESCNRPAKSTTTSRKSVHIMDGDLANRTNHTHATWNKTRRMD
jgi:hypothetical protein